MIAVNALKPEQLDFENADDIKNLDDFIGQPRALAALDLGVGIKHEGYHIFALGEAGTAKHPLIRRFLDKQAAEEKVLADICYVNNFEEQHKLHFMILEP